MKDFQPDFHRRLLLIYFFISAEVHVLVVAGTWLPARLDSGFVVCESICYHTAIQKLCSVMMMMMMMIMNNINNNNNYNNNNNQLFVTIIINFIMIIIIIY